jgi:uncharacterized protein YecT (DUF1311 family)
MVALSFNMTAAHVAALLALLSSGAVPTPAHTEDRLYDWSDEAVAVVSATSIARECLEWYGDSLKRYSCVGRAATICRSQYDDGKDNQYDANQCTGFAASGWERVLDEVYDRLTKSGAAPKRIETSQSMWKAWNDFDCHAIADYVGTRAAMDFGGCRMNHAAERAFDLIQLIPR